MDNISKELVKGTAISIILAVSLPVVAANTYVGFQTWLGHVMCLQFSIPNILRRYYRPIDLDRRHVLLAFAASGLFFNCIALSLLIWGDLWNLIPWSIILSLFFGGNGALGRIRDLRRQQKQHQKEN